MLRPVATCTCVMLVASCGGDAAEASDHLEHAGEPIAILEAALEGSDPVSLAVAQSCTTSVVKGLSTQLVEEMQCLRPGTFASIDKMSGVSLGAAVFSWLQTPARDALLAAQKQRNVTITINSALRTLPQQYLLYRWYKANRCGIGLAASPGKSNHESALAVDIEDNAAWRAAMALHEFDWFGAGDPVHFDFKGDKQIDIGGLSVTAFQRLWNRNHPEDRIDEDSEYGPATEERLAKAPVGGFPKGADCGEPQPSAPPAVHEPESESDAGSLGASGARPDGEAQGCAMTLVRGSRASPFVMLTVGLVLVGRTRRRCRAVAGREVAGRLTGG